MCKRNYIRNFSLCLRQEMLIWSDFKYTSPSVCTHKGIEVLMRTEEAV